ncbi:unnamed protein product, partial [Meganyctiphanes norvegica]
LHTAQPQPSRAADSIIFNHIQSISLTMNSHSTTLRTVLVAALASVALASQTRHYDSSNLGGIFGAGLGVGSGLGSAGVGSGGYGSSGSCRYWCRTPQGQAYCCEGGNEVASLPTVKPGQCPPVRPQCPPTRLGFRPPQQCSNDSRCPGVEKCCFDTCLQHHTCKAPISIYG